MLEKIDAQWNPNTRSTPGKGPDEENSEEDGEGTTVIIGDETGDLKDAITIFGGENDDETQPAGNAANTAPGGTRTTTVYTDGACINNGTEEAQAGYGVWFGEDDPRNSSGRVPHKIQSNQTGELMAVLVAVKTHIPNEHLRIISDSKYVVEGLTKHRRRWESRGWVDVNNGDIFKSITAWIKQRGGRTSLQ